MKEVIKTYGKLDILVNNAGITRDNLIMKMSEEDFDAVIDANLKGCFNTIKAVSRQMLKQRAGRIINITSVSGILGNAGQANYAASKAGHHRPDQDDGKGAGKQRHYGECGGAGICGYGYDTGASRKRERGRDGADSSGTVWKTGGYRQYGSLSGVREGVLYHRTDISVDGGMAI